MKEGGELRQSTRARALAEARLVPRNIVKGAVGHRKEAACGRRGETDNPDCTSEGG